MEILLSPHLEGKSIMSASAQNCHHIGTDPRTVITQELTPDFSENSQIPSAFLLKCHILPLLNISLNARGTGDKMLALAKPRQD